MKKLLLPLILIIIIAGGVIIFFAVRHDNKTTSQPTTVSTNQSATSTTPQSQSTITYNGSGFSPASLTVKAGTVVTISNTSSSTVQVQSNPHPLHTDDPDLNVGAIQAGQSATFTANQKGTFGYHNHLDPSQTGSITVQ